MSEDYLQGDEPGFANGFSARFRKGNKPIGFYSDIISVVTQPSERKYL